MQRRSLPGRLVAGAILALSISVPTARAQQATTGVPGGDGIGGGSGGSISGCALPDRPGVPREPAAAFRLCGGPDPAAERAIAQLIAGRGFRAELRGGPDGCAELTVHVTPGPPVSGRQVVVLTVGPGSSGRSISVRIVSRDGTTEVTTR